MNTCPTLQSCKRACENLVFQNNPWKKAAHEKNHHIRKKTKELEILSDVLVVNANERLLM